MNIWSLANDKTRYLPMQNSWSLRSLEDEGLLFQIWYSMEKVPRRQDQQRWLVFSSADEAIVETLAHQVIGMGSQRIRVDGRDIPAPRFLVETLIKPFGFVIDLVPRDGVCNRPIAEIKDWALAITRQYT